MSTYDYTTAANLPLTQLNDPRYRAVVIEYIKCYVPRSIEALALAAVRAA
ncbi:hypothetical protein DZ956_022195 [Pseudomonas aeruginosa]|nr:hypothetical protein [Pseudomonas aeruginosa]NPZ19489.1 hypothetical protein [Pseudomonas aeruginosa]